MNVVSYLLPILFLSTTSFASTPDRYANFAELAAHQKEGVDFTVEAIDRKSPYIALAIHGGKIEPHSDEVARAIANTTEDGSQFNLYVFTARLPKDNHILHITSTHFDDPRVLALLKKSRIAVSVHGFKEENLDKVCVGGGNAHLREKVANEIKKAELGMTVETPCTEFGGDSSDNVVNRTSDQGVQLELSTHLRDRLHLDRELLDKFALVVKKAVSP